MNEEFNYLYERFTRLERAPYEEILVHQATTLERLLRYVRRQLSPLASRVAPLFEGEEFHPERWAELPILSRYELRQVAPSLKAFEDPDEVETIRVFSTSGSTGEPVSVRRNALAVDVPTYMRERMYRWHGFDVNARLADINVSRSALWPDGKIFGPWSAVGPEGARVNLSVFTSVERQIDWLRRMQPKYLMTLAMNLFEIADAAGADGKELGIKAAIASGSALLPQTRQVVAQNLGARVVETYGSQEVGLIAIECPASGLLHVCADHLVVEVLDEHGEPVGPGETGRIVLTSLYNYVTPLLRYELGDLVETADRPCACGRTLPSLKRVIGRIRKALVFPDGTHVRPHAIILAAGDEELLPAKQFQVVQTASAKFTIRYIPLDANRYAAAEAIQARFKEMVHPAVEVTLERVSEIARAASGKFEDFVYLNAGKSEPGGIS